MGRATSIEEALEDHLRGDAIPALAALLVGEAGLNQNSFCCSGGKAFIPEDDRQSCDVGKPAGEVAGLLGRTALPAISMER